jgi:hypothetical protein
MAGSWLWRVPAAHTEGQPAVGDVRKERFAAKQLDKGLPLVLYGPLPPRGTASALLNRRACRGVGGSGRGHIALAMGAECADTVRVTGAAVRTFGP